MTSEGSTRAVVDRIEGDLAVLVLYEDDSVRFNLPVRFLPEGLKEGDHLRISFETDDASRDSEKRRISSLLDELKNR